jgi:hypothetical protein
VTIEFIPPGEDWFPNPAGAGADGLLAFGGDLAPGRLLRAYSQGIFPWYGPGDPILWWAPDPRCVLAPEALHVPRSLARTLRRRTYAVTIDRAFARVIRACARTPRPDAQGTWLMPEMIEAYVRLHALGAATAPRPGPPTAPWRAASTAWPWGGCFSANPCSTPRPTHPRPPSSTSRACWPAGATASSTASRPPATCCASAPRKCPVRAFWPT